MNILRHLYIYTQITFLIIYYITCGNIAREFIVKGRDEEYLKLKQNEYFYVTSTMGTAARSKIKVTMVL